MKILKVNLIAFGPFTETVLDLSEGEEGLHIIYGPNEAGKSSALRALRQMLYGIPDRSADDFLHQSPGQSGAVDGYRPHRVGHGEDDRGGDHRAAQRPAPHLVDARDEPVAGGTSLLLEPQGADELDHAPQVGSSVTTSSRTLLSTMTGVTPPLGSGP